MKLKAKSNDDLPHVEYKQFDTETLAVIANLGSSSNENIPRTDSLTVAAGNHSQFVFCLTNPCENGGTCFVTNTATTKVRLDFSKGNFCIFLYIYREFVCVVMDMLVITVKFYLIIQQLVLEFRRVIVHQVHV
jgi:hypothetical protein